MGTNFFRSVFSGIGDAELLADFLHEVVVDVGMAGNGYLFTCQRIDKNAMVSALLVEVTALAVEIPYELVSLHTTATLR